jgi:MoaA/NifB/PqqE/SkfB family radical SAM enzyme
MQKIGGNLKFREFKEIIDNNKNIQLINFTGIGEALLNPEFIEMIEYSKKKGIYVWFNDNFTLMNQEKAEKLIDAGVDFIVLSLDGATKETYEKIRVGAKFNKVTENFKKLNELRNKKKLLKPKLGINMVVLKENYMEIEEMVKLANELKADNLMYANIITSDNTGKLSLWNLTSSEIEEYVEAGKRKAKELKVEVIAWPVIKPQKQKKQVVLIPGQIHILHLMEMYCLAVIFHKWEMQE